MHSFMQQHCCQHACSSEAAFCKISDGEESSVEERAQYIHDFVIYNDDILPTRFVRHWMAGIITALKSLGIIFAKQKVGI